MRANMFINFSCSKCGCLLEIVKEKSNIDTGSSSECIQTQVMVKPCTFCIDKELAPYKEKQKAWDVLTGGKP